MQPENKNILLHQYMLDGSVYTIQEIQPISDTSVGVKILIKDSDGILSWRTYIPLEQPISKTTSIVYQEHQELKSSFSDLFEIIAEQQTRLNQMMEKINEIIRKTTKK